LLLFWLLAGVDMSEGGAVKQGLYQQQQVQEQWQQVQEGYSNVFGICQVLGVTDAAQVTMSQHLFLLPSICLKRFRIIWLKQ